MAFLTSPAGTGGHNRHLNPNDENAFPGSYQKNASPQQQPTPGKFRRAV